MNNGENNDELNTEEMASALKYVSKEIGISEEEVSKEFKFFSDTTNFILKDKKEQITEQKRRRLINRLFPNGTPSNEEFLLTMAKLDEKKFNKLMNDETYDINNDEELSYIKNLNINKKTNLFSRIINWFKKLIKKFKDI